MTQQPQMPPGGLPGLKQAVGKFTEKLQEAAEKKKTETQQEPEPQQRHGETRLSVVTPNTQTINDQTILWVWNGSIFDVEATYCRVVWNMRSAGDYLIELIFDGDFPTGDGLTGEQAREIARVLLSAENWQHVWPQHMGEFLVAKPVADLHIGPKISKTEIEDSDDDSSSDSDQ